MKKINLNNYLYIEGDESGHMKDYPTCWDAYRALKEIKDFDRRHGIKDNYHVMWVCNNVEYELKLIKRKNKLTYKII
jgi:hypothetical protein